MNAARCCLVGCFVVVFSLGCSPCIVVRLLFGLARPVPGPGAKFSSTFLFRLATILNIFWRCLFTERMWAAGGNTQYKSHLDLCHAFNWLLCRCHGVAHSSLLPVPPSASPRQAQSLAKPPSISCEIEFGGGQRLKNTSGKVCAGTAWHDWLAAPSSSASFCRMCLDPAWAAARLLPAIKSKFFWPPSSGFSVAIKNEFRAASLVQSQMRI